MLWIQDLTVDDGERSGNGGMVMERDRELRSRNEMDVLSQENNQQVGEENEK